MPVDLLPESRMRAAKSSIPSSMGNLVQIYCANCGTPYGMVPETMITFAFALCEKCAETHGDIAHTLKEPDAVFWERVNDAILEAAERERSELAQGTIILDVAELYRRAEDPSSPFAKLAADWQRHATSFIR